MSRWFPERLLVRVGDAPRALAGAPGEGKLDSMLAAFERELERLAPKRGTRITCIVAGEGARYRIVPWNDELTSPAQRQVLAEHCFRHAYGDAARDWAVRQHTARHGAATLACALDAALLDRLDAAAQSRQLKLISVQPSLMHAYNQLPPPPGDTAFWFVCIEPLWATALLMSPTEPLHVKQMPSPDLDLDLALERERFALGLDGPRSPVHAVRAGPHGSDGVSAPLWQAA